MRFAIEFMLLFSIRSDLRERVSKRGRGGEDGDRRRTGRRGKKRKKKKSPESFSPPNSVCLSQFTLFFSMMFAFYVPSFSFC